MVEQFPNDTALRPVQKLTGLCAAAIVSWAMINFIIIGPSFLKELFGKGTAWRALETLADYGYWAIVVGLPLSFFVCVVFGYPVWLLVEWLGMRSVVHAAMCGTIVGAAIIFSFFISELNSIDPSSSYYENGQGLVVNGIPTEHWWRARINSIFAMAVVGATSGIVARVAAGCVNSK